MYTNSNDVDGYSHGTKVAGCIAAVGNNGIGISGVCPNCRMLPTTVGGSVSSELAGVNYILSKGIRVVNLSVGGPRSEAEYNTFKDNHHALFVVAAGNEACDLDRIAATTNPFPCLDKYGSSAGFPASLSSELLNVVSVGSITSAGEISSFSSFGSTRVQVFAPGSDIYTTSINAGEPGYSSRSGTSYAAPIVAGVAVLVLQKYPSLSSCQLREALIQGCVENPRLKGKAECNGQLSAYEALKQGKRISEDLSLYEGEYDYKGKKENCANSNGECREERGEKEAIVSAELKQVGSVAAKYGADEAKAVAGERAGLRKVGTGANVTGEKTVAVQTVHVQTVPVQTTPSHSSVILKRKGQNAKTPAVKPAFKVATTPVRQGTVNATHGKKPLQEGELFLEAIVEAIAKSGIIVDAGMLEVTVTLLLSLVSNIDDPLAVKAEGLPVGKYLNDLEQGISLEPAYGDINGLSRGPISLLLNPLTHAKQFLSSNQVTPLDQPKNGSVPLDLGFGINIVDPLLFGKMIVMDLMNLGAGSSNSSTGNGISEVLVDPLELWLSKIQQKLLKKSMAMNPVELIQDTAIIPLELIQETAMQFGETLLKPVFGGNVH
eukprot:GHVS01066145.1.p1 GENE.GHVS01066145.1~~GHVS01066145.1.p1  ORF type:complete len:605 (+),score=82.11 GHVS01066145.1:1046-2860(+)